MHLIVYTFPFFSLHTLLLEVCSCFSTLLVTLNMISDGFFPVNVMLLPQTILKQKNKAKILKLSLCVP
jgi:hypothetical protein